MELVLTFVKQYFVLMLLFFLLAYLAPKEEYRRYFHFFISILVALILMQPLLVYVGGRSQSEVKEQLQQIVKQMECIEYQEKGETIFEQYLGKDFQKEK